MLELSVRMVGWGAQVTWGAAGKLYLSTSQVKAIESYTINTSNIITVKDGKHT